MIERGRGHVINLGSIFHRYPYAMSHVYNSTKAFVENFTQGLRADLLGTDVKVSTIEPGLVLTEFVERRFHGDQELIKKRCGRRRRAAAGGHRGMHLVLRQYAAPDDRLAPRGG